jgi:hypothetical protein
MIPANSVRPATTSRSGYESPNKSDLYRWVGLFRIAAGAALLMLLLIPLAIIVFAVWPPPFDETASEWFELYQDNWLLGLLSLDLLFLLSNVLMIPIYLALYVALRRVSESLMLVALALGLVGLAAYFSSNPAFQMLLLSNRHESATGDEARASLIAAGEAMLATFEGTAFNVYYVFGAVALLLIATVMLRSAVFSRRTAYVGLASGALMVVPATAGTLGLVFALASLVPWIVFLVLIALRFLELGQVGKSGEADENP